MRKIAFIPTRDPGQRIEVEHYLIDAGWTVNLLFGRSSIFEAYYDASLAIQKDDQVIFCHDDIQILTDKQVFNTILDHNLSNPKTGFVGVAGTARLDNTGCWWNGLTTTHPANTHLRGMIYHGADLSSARPSYYGPLGDAMAMDGVFLAATGKTLLNIRLSKPFVFESDWDFYDLYYTMQATISGRTNKVVPISLLHKSIGGGAMTEQWNKSRLAFVNSFKKHLVG